MNDLPKGWGWKKLCQITECLDSKRIPVTKNQREKGDVPYYGANGIQGYVKEFIFDEELLLLAEDGGSWSKGQKCAYIVKGKSWVNNHAHVLRMKPLILIKFLEAYLNRTDLNKHISGTTRGKLNQKQMNDIEVPVPPLQTQKRIAAILERAEQLKEKREQANEDTNTIIQSLFYEMFGDPQSNEKGWPVFKLSEVCDTSSGGTPSRRNKEYYDGDIPWVKSGEVNNLIIQSTEEHISDEGLKNSSAKFFDSNSVLVAMYGATAGKSAILKIKATTNQAICAINPKRKDNLNFWYLLYYFKSIEKLLVSQSIGGGQPNISQQIIKQQIMQLPPITLQNKFASLVERIEMIRSYQKKATEEINLLFDALIQKAFNGVLVS